MKMPFSEEAQGIISASSVESPRSLIAKLETTLRRSIILLLVTHVTSAASSAKPDMGWSAIGQGTMLPGAEL